MRDPLMRMQMRLLRDGVLSAEQINELEKGLDREAADAAEEALKAPLPSITGITQHVYSEDLDPVHSPFANEQPAVLGFVHYAVSFLWGRLFRLAIFHQFDSLQQSHAAHFADERMLLLQFFQL